MIDELGRHAFVVVAALGLMLGPPFVAFWILQRRKRAARQLRRSPLTTGLLRPPGHSVREQLEELRGDIGIDVVVLIVVPVYPLAIFQLQSLATGKLVSGGVVLLAFLVAACFVGWQIRKLLQASKELDKWRLGYDAELAVGQELDQLMRDGAVVFHDMPAERFNIDHVVIARQGVFAVETKGYTKPNRDGGTQDATVVYDGRTLALPDRSGSWAIEQAQRQAKWLARWLTGATGEPIHVTPVLAMPGWYVERKGQGEVLVLSGKELHHHLLKARSAKPLTAEQVRRVVHQVEQRCRNVEPTYRPDEDKAT